MKFHRPAFLQGVCMAAAVFLPLPVAAQIGATTEASNDVIQVAFDAISFASGDSTNARLDVYVQVGYDQMSFVRSNGSYRAEYEATLDVLDEKGDLVVEKSWTDQATTDSFDVSISPQYYMMSEKSLALQPGNYTLKMNFTDQESKEGVRETRKILIPDYFHRKTELSDIMLVSKLTREGTRQIVTPNIAGNVGNLEGGFYLFFEYYPEMKEDSVEFQVSFVNSKKESFSTKIVREEVKNRLMQMFLKIDTVNAPPGEYTLVLASRMVGKNVSGGAVSTTQRPVSLRWKGIPLSVSDLDEAIKQLRYIAKDAELDSLLEAATVAAKQKLFMEFWKKRDPTPDTHKNELMEEYYSRVAYANRHFTRYRAGWKTDMGMIYIIFGPPNSVDRHPFEMDSKPYEIWTYYDIRQSILFIDETGFGDYRLQNLDWELQRRLQN